MGEFEEDKVDWNRAQDANGSVNVAIPADIARTLGIEPGDQVMFSGKSGENEARVKKLDPSSMLAD